MKKPNPRRHHATMADVERAKATATNEAIKRTCYLMLYILIARDALLEKLFDDMPEEERIAAFVEAHEAGRTYSDKDFFEWHHRLTGSCEMGRMEFARNHGLESLDGSRTVEEFIALCENAYGGGIIKKLKEFYTQQEG